MDLNYQPEQVLLKETADRFLKDRYSFEHRARILASGMGWSPDIWAEFAALGWLALPFAEEHGGLGAGAVETSVIMEAMGRALVLEPYVACVVLAGSLIETVGTEAQKAELLDGLMAGTLRPALAHLEPQGGFDIGRIEALAIPEGESYRLEGRKALVLGGQAADVFLVSALLAGEIRVFVVPAGTPGLQQHDVVLVDGSRASDLVLSDVFVPVSALCGAGDVRDQIEAACDRASAALASEAVGIMDVLLETTVAYLKQRQQFGKPLASFQALQHRVAEMAVKCEEARASALLATLSVDAPRALRIRGVSGARAKIGKVARSVAQEAIQLHGAMGFSEELPVGAWFRRLYAIENTFGTTSDHLRRYGEIIRDPAVLSAGLLREPA